VTKNDYYEFVMDAFRPAKTLIGMVPADKLDWRPGPKFMSLGQLINHLSEPMGDGLRCLITNKWPFTPEQMEEDFAQMPVSAPWGWKGKLEVLALSFREHFTNHKMQLFTYLKLLGLPVDTSTLYGA
jgi:hypothetical protein